jgi:anti-anti-sigma factor
MDYNFGDQNGVLLVNVSSKRATVEFSESFKTDLIRHIEQVSDKVVVNLSKVDFIDSSFLGALVAGLKKTAVTDGNLKIGCLRTPVRAMFELTMLYRIFDIYDQFEEAVESYN